MKTLIIENDPEKKIYNDVHCKMIFSSEQDVLEIKFITKENIIKYVMHNDMEVKSIFTVLKLVSEIISEDEVVIMDYQERDYVTLKGKGRGQRFTAQRYIEYCNV